jgi:hypothetical protein
MPAATKSIALELLLRPAELEFGQRHHGPHSGIGWNLSPDLGLAFGGSVLAALHRWTEAGVYDQVHGILPRAWRRRTRSDWPRAAMNTAHIAAK